MQKEEFLCFVAAAFDLYAWEGCHNRDHRAHFDANLCVLHSGSPLRVRVLSLSLPDFSETDIPVIGEGKHTLKIEATCCNIKKIDLKFYGIEKATCQVTIKCNGKEWKTTEERGLDPTWEQHVIFKINDPETDKISAVFHCAGIQLGDEQFYSLDKLLKGKQTFKGLVVPGGKADMLFTAVDFGSEEAPQEDDAFMDFL